MDNKRVQIPGELLGAIKTRPQKEIETFFDDLVKEKAMQITGCQTTEDLWKHQAKIQAYLEMKQFFLSEMKR